MQNSIKRSRVFALFFSVFAIFMLLLQTTVMFNVFAEDDIPDNGIGGTQIVQEEAQSNNSTKKNVDAADVFGNGIQQSDPTGFSATVGSFLDGFAGFIINCVVYAFGALITIYFSVDALIMAFPLAAKIFATMVPIQLFSNEAGRIAGVKFAGKKKGSGENSIGNDSLESSGSLDKEGGKKKSFISKYKEYFANRTIAVVISGILIVLVWTGLLTDLLNLAINWIIGLFG